MGSAGVSGSLTGLLTNRFGTRRVHGLALAVMAIGTLGLAATSFSTAYGFAAMGLFGAAYIVSTGTYLIQGIELLSDRPDLGLGLPFLVLALGQSVGTPLFGATLAEAGPLIALAISAATACFAMIVPLNGQGSGRCRSLSWKPNRDRSATKAGH